MMGFFIVDVRFSFRYFYSIPTIIDSLCIHVWGFLRPLGWGISDFADWCLKLHVVLKPCVVCLDCGL
jgi:hypothetical protein